MTSVVIIGAGSMVFTQTLVSDLAQDEGTRETELRLVDLDSERLATAGEMARRIFAEAGASGSVSLHHYPIVPDWPTLTRGWISVSSMQVPAGLRAVPRVPIDSPEADTPPSRFWCSAA